MGIGTSLGAFFEDSFQHHAGNEYLTEPNSTPDNNELSTNEVMPHPDEEPKIVPIANLTNTPDEIMSGVEGVRAWQNRGVAGPTQIRRGANDNKNLDLGTGGMSEKDIDASWARFRRGNEIIESRGRLMDKLRDSGLNDLEHQKLKNLNKEHEQHFNGYTLD